METIAELQAKVQKYTDAGFTADVVKAAREAQNATCDYIRRTHPQTGFGGMEISKYIQKGKFTVENVGVVNATVYANYFARWYNTGAYGRAIRKRGPRQGMKGPEYAPHGNYFEKNAQAIEQYFTDYLLNYLKEHIDL